MEAFLNGRFLPESQAVVPISDRGFLYGDGLFETLRIFRGRPFRWNEHFMRLEGGAKFLRIRMCWDGDQLGRLARTLIERNKVDEAILRVTLTRGSGSRGYSCADAVNPTLAMTLHPSLLAPASVRLRTAPFRVGLCDPLLRWKTANRLLNVLARAEAEDGGADEGLLLNSEGRIAECAASNIFWMEGGTVCTPPLSEGALDGITRSIVLQLCRKMNAPTLERAADLARLSSADGVFVTNSVLGIVPASELDGHVLTMSSFMAELQSGYAILLREETSG